jgi:hypothetical protein
MTVHSTSIEVPLIQVNPVGVGAGRKFIPVRTPIGASPPTRACRSVIFVVVGVGVGANVSGGANLPLRWIGAAGILFSTILCQPKIRTEEAKITSYDILMALDN